MNNRKYKYITKWEVRVDGRIFELSKTEERKNEIVPILKSFYPNAEITATKKRERKYI